MGGSASLAAAWGKKAGIGFAVAASVALNEVENNVVRASIEESRVTATNDITVTADLKPVIEATNFGVAVAAGGGGKIGVQVAGAGIGSYNNLAQNTTGALVNNRAAVTSTGGSVQLTATDDSHLKAHGGTGSLAVSGSKGSAVGGAVGASVAVNRLGTKLVTNADGELSVEQQANRVRAQIVGQSRVTANQNVAVEAFARGTIDALNISIALAAAAGKQTGVGVAGAVIGSYNLLNNAVVATIKGRGTTVTANHGAVTVTAQDTATLKADGGAIAVAAGLSPTGAGGAGALAAAIAVNELSNTLKAEINNNAAVTASKNVDLFTLADNQINSLNIGGSLAVGAGKVGIGVSLAGAGSYNVLSSRIATTIQDSATVTSNNGSVTLRANDNSRVIADGGAVSVALAGGSKVGVGVSVGLSIAINKLENTLKASIEEQATVTAHNNVNLTATSTATIHALNFGGSLAVGAGASAGVALSGAGVGATNSLTNRIWARIQADSQVTATTGNVNLTATDDSTILARSYVVSASVAAAGKGGAVAGSAAIAVANNLLNSTVEAFVDQSRQIQAQDLTLNATANSDIDAEVVSVSVAVGAALVGVGIAASGIVSENKINNTVQSFVRGTTLSTPNVTISATETVTLNTDNYVVSAGIGIGGVAGGGANSKTTINSATSAYVTGNHDWSVADLTITATSNTSSHALWYCWWHWGGCGCKLGHHH